MQIKFWSAVAQIIVCLIIMCKYDIPDRMVPFRDWGNTVFMFTVVLCFVLLEFMSFFSSYLLEELGPSGFQGVEHVHLSISSLLGLFIFSDVFSSFGYILGVFLSLVGSILFIVFPNIFGPSSTVLSIISGEKTGSD